MAVKEMDLRLAVSRFRGRLRSVDVFAHGLLGNGRGRESDGDRGEVIRKSIILKVLFSRF